MVPTNKDLTAAEETVTLTSDEKRRIWISAAVALAVLLVLFFVGLFVGSGVRTDSVFLPGFYWIANVIAAVASGMLASTISGFLVVKFEGTRKTAGKNVRYLIQGTGGFGVTLLVFWANPQSKMFTLADTLFLSLVSDCEQAARVGDGGLRSNARESCIRLISLYPYRPEPYSFLARWTNLNKDDGSGEASYLFRKAVKLYGLDPIVQGSVKKVSLSPVQLVRLSQDMSSFSFATGDYWLTTYSRGGLSLNRVLLGFDEVVEASFILSDELLNSDSDPNIWARAFDVRGKSYLYEFFLKGGQSIELLKKAATTFDTALTKVPDHPLVLEYHRFVVQVLLFSHFEPTERERTANAFRQVLGNWDSYFGTREFQVDRAAFKQFFSQVVKNERPEPWRVTSIFGSKKFGGAEIRDFIIGDPPLLAKLNDRIRDL
jgi:hypothetical protein